MNVCTVGKCHFCARGGANAAPVVTVEAPSGIVRICAGCAARALRLITGGAAKGAPAGPPSGSGKHPELA